MTVRVASGVPTAWWLLTLVETADLLPGAWAVVGLCTLLTVPFLALSMPTAFSRPWPLRDRAVIVVGIVAGISVWLTVWSRFNSFAW
jgi:hypothetical protein